MVSGRRWEVLTMFEMQPRCWRNKPVAGKLRTAAELEIVKNSRMENGELWRTTEATWRLPTWTEQVAGHQRRGMDEQNRARWPENEQKPTDAEIGEKQSSGERLCFARLRQRLQGQNSSPVTRGEGGTSSTERRGRKRVKLSDEGDDRKQSNGGAAIFWAFSGGSSGGDGGR